jgi:hypothetical protein
MASYDDPEAPLDPAAIRLRAKMVRLLFVSGGIMLLGLVAVFAAIVYKVSERGHRPDFSAAAPVSARLAVPAGTHVVAAALDGDRALLTLAAPDGATSLLLVDLTTGAILGRYGIGSE